MVWKIIYIYKTNITGPKVFNQKRFCCCEIVLTMDLYNYVGIHDEPINFNLSLGVTKHTAEIPIGGIIYQHAD